MVDELHVVDDESRGVIIESFLTRLLVLQNFQEFSNTNFNKLRIVALSATLSNIKDLGYWLKVKKENIFVFGAEYRPVKLNKLIFGYQPKNNAYVFNYGLNYKINQII